jgi:hypothetical protein
MKPNQTHPFNVGKQSANNPLKGEFLIGSHSSNFELYFQNKNSNDEWRTNKKPNQTHPFNVGKQSANNRQNSLKGEFHVGSRVGCFGNYILKIKSTKSTK